MDLIDGEKVGTFPVIHTFQTNKANVNGNLRIDFILESNLSLQAFLSTKTTSLTMR